MELQVDATLLQVVIAGTIKGLSMTDVTPVPVGASRLASASHTMSVIVGLVGKSSGSTTLNLSEWGMLYLAGRLLGEDQSEVTEDNVDAMMEIGNMVAGSFKEALVGTAYEIKEISLPSLIIGQRYSMIYARGMTTVAVEFELPDVPMARMQDRFFSASISLMRRSGSAA